MKQVFEQLLGLSFNAAKKSDLAYCFIAQNCGKDPVNQLDISSFNTLYKVIDLFDNKFIFWTPNTFFTYNRRERMALRWLNAFFVDIDIKDNPGLTFPDVIDRITTAGLPPATLILKTPRGGFHVYWFLCKPARATMPTVKLFEVITNNIAQEMGADLLAIGAERYMRLPNEDNILFYDKDNTYSFDFFKDWREVNGLDDAEPVYNNNIKVLPKGILSHPAVKELLKGVGEGIRDNTCFTLALCLRSEGFSEDEALPVLESWNKKNTPPLPLSDLYIKIKSAYSGKYHGPSSEWITKLSGIDFEYKLISQKIPRSERKRIHIEEWEQDILAFLDNQGGSWCGSQSELAAAIKAPLRSVKQALKYLISKIKVSLRVEGKGRLSKTYIQLITPSKTVKIFKRNRKEEDKPYLHSSEPSLMVHTHIHPKGRDVLRGAQDKGNGGIPGFKHKGRNTEQGEQPLLYDAQGADRKIYKP
jgi:hypothetical protein